MANMTRFLRLKRNAALVTNVVLGIANRSLWVAGGTANIHTVRSNPGDSGIIENYGQMIRVKQAPKAELAITPSRVLTFDGAGMLYPTTTARDSRSCPVSLLPETNTTNGR